MHSNAELQALFSALIGKPVDDNFCLFPPIHTEFGKNITVGKACFINADCVFQDQGGISIGDNCLIGHQVAFLTLNHGESLTNRQDLIPKKLSLKIMCGLVQKQQYYRE